MIPTSLCSICRREGPWLIRCRYIPKMIFCSRECKVKTLLHFMRDTNNYLLDRNLAVSYIRVYMSHEFDVNFDYEL